MGLRLHAPTMDREQVNSGHALMYFGGRWVPMLVRDSIFLSGVITALIIAVALAHAFMLTTGT